MNLKNIDPRFRLQDWNVRRCAGEFLWLAVIVLLPSAAVADCAGTKPPTCSYVPVGAILSIAPTAFDSPSPACLTVLNQCETEVMVPTGMQDEWTSFYQNHETCAVVSSCSGITYNWGDWGVCSAKCGGGTQSRSCLGSDGKVYPDSDCPGGEAAATQACDTQACGNGGATCGAGPLYSGFGNPDGGNGDTPCPNPANANTLCFTPGRWEVGPRGQPVQCIQDYKCKDGNWYEYAAPGCSEEG